MDETKNTGQDPSSGKTGQASGGKSGSTSKKGKLYTDAEILKIKSDAAAEAGRLRKAAEQERDNLSQELQATKNRLDSLEKEVNESRLAEVRGDPEQLRLYQREEVLKKRERDLEERLSDLARREAQYKSDKAQLDKDKSVVSIAYIAAKHGLETEELESLGISDPDTLDRVAEKLATGRKGAEPGEAEGGDAEGGEGEVETPGGESFTPDSGVTTGSVGALTDEQIANMTPEQYAAHPSVKNRFK